MDTPSPPHPPSRRAVKHVLLMSEGSTGATYAWYMLGANGLPMRGEIFDPHHGGCCKTLQKAR